MLVHDKGWTVKLLPDDSAEWSDPQGRTTITIPDPTAPHTQAALDRLARDGPHEPTTEGGRGRT
jgi:hypothetical protein